jgi:hypothetical protein
VVSDRQGTFVIAALDSSLVFYLPFGVDVVVYQLPH